MAQIKGMAILGTLRFVKETAGEEHIEELMSFLSPVAQATYARPILAGTWYPYEAYASLLDVVAERLGGGRPDFPATLGRFAAQRDVGTIFKIVATLLSASRTLQAAGRLWSRYCDTGRFVMTSIESERAEGHIDGFPEITTVHEQLLTGWIAGMGLAAGARDPHVELVSSVHDGARVSAYTMRWRNG